MSHGAVRGRENGDPRRWLRALEWLPGYSFLTLRRDGVAGVTLAAYVLPAAIGDASLARLPPEAGIYACIFSGLVYWLLCSGTRSAVTVTSAISLLMGTTLGNMTQGDPARFGALAAGTAVMVAGLAVVAWAIGAGALVSFISESVMLGFKAGVALALASTQVPKLLGIAGVHGGFWDCSYQLFTRLHETNPASLAVGGGALAVLVAGKVLLRDKPVGLVVVVVAVIISAWAGLESRGVKLLGEVPQGFPPVHVPAIHWSDLNELLPLALACFLLSAVESTAIGRMFGAKHATRFDAGQEFLALAGANAAAGLGGGYPVGAGMSQSLVNDGAGARTPASGLIASVAMLAVAVFLSGALRDLPQPVLAAIVLTAIPGLFNVRALARLWKLDRSELVIAATALAGVLASGILRGVLIGAVISMVLLIRRAARPHIAILGRIPGTRRFSDMARHADNQPVPGVLVFRPEGSLLYFNAEHVRESVLAAVRGEPGAVRMVVCDLSAAPQLDLAGAEMLKDLSADLAAVGAGLRIVEARSSVRDRLRAVEFKEPYGRIDRFTSVADAVEAFESGNGVSSEGEPGPAK